MGIKLVTFAAQTVTPQDDALIYETALQESGMIYGGSVSIKNANVLHVEAGHGALCGRKFTIEATDVPVPLTPSGSLQGRIYIHMDLSDTGEPISFQVETASTLTPVVQQSDVNINSGIYEINLATFIVDTSTISNLVNVAPFIDISPDSEFSASSKNPLMNKAITKAIGDPETIGGSASQPYTKGALLLATDGQIYEVTQNIALHGSIVNGGNVRPTGNIISQISNLVNVFTYTTKNEIFDSTNANVMSSYVVKQSRVVNLSFTFANYQLTQNVWTILGTLKSKFRPTFQQDFNAVSNTDGRSFQARITTAGVVEIWVPSTITHSSIVSLTYIAANSDH